MRLRILLLALAATGALAGSADAETICVQAPSGSACDDVQGGLQAALDAAVANSGPDTILLGAADAPIEGPFVYPNLPVVFREPVTVKGVGSDRPLLTGPAGEDVFAGSEVTLEGIDLRVPSSDGGIGFHGTDSTLRDVRISGPGAKAGGATGIVGEGDLTLDNVQVTGTGGIGALFQHGHSTATGLRINDVASGIGPNDDAQLDLSGSRISATQNAFAARGVATVSSTLLETTAAGAKGVEAGDGDITFDHVSVVHRGPVDGTDAAFLLHPVDAGGSADLRSVVVGGFTRGFLRDTTDNNAPYPIAIRDSVWDPSHDVFTGRPSSADVTESNDAHVDPHLVDAPAGDFRLRGSSAAIDRDSQTPAGYTDLDGVAAVGAADAGAFEYRRRAPSIDATDVPGSGATGQALTFAATASDADGDAVQIAWEFGDGAIGAGAQASHTFAAPGLYAVTLHVTDEAGLGATRTFSVAISGAAAKMGGGGGTTEDLVAPKLSKVRLSRDHRRVLFTVSERAKVRVTAHGRTIVRTVAAGRRSIRIARVRRGTVRLRAVDGAGNRSALRTLHVKVTS
jgi:hypothetical protein